MGRSRQAALDVACRRRSSIFGRVATPVEEDRAVANRRVPALLLLTLLAAAACKANDQVACPLPPNLTADAGGGQCRGARLLLRCQLAMGATQICLSNDPSRCSDGMAASGTDASAPGGCTQLCAPGEYGVACGGPGPGATFTPPTGCKEMLPTPGGVVFYCCPCTP
jgi:hypothetical protein